VQKAGCFFLSSLDFFGSFCIKAKMNKNLNACYSVFFELGHSVFFVKGKYYQKYVCRFAAT